MTNVRYDRALIRTRRDSDGFLYSDSTVGRTGVLLYRNADGTTRRELRLPEEAGSAATLQSMIGKPVIVTHNGGMVDRDNAKNRIVGVMISARQDGQLTNSEMVIHDGDAITAAEKGLYTELSLGYRLTLEKRSGYYHPGRNEIREDAAEGFEPFDYIQRNITVNHVALVRAARAGSVARLNLDGDEIDITEDYKTMAKITLSNGTTVEVSDEVAAHVSDLQTRLDGATAEVSTTKGALVAITADRDGLKKTVEGIPAQLEQVRKDAAEELAASANLKASVAHRVTDVAGKSDIEIKRAFIAVALPSANLDGLDDNGIDGTFRAALAICPADGKQPTNADTSRKHVGGDKGTRNDSADDGACAADTAYAKYCEKMGIK